MIRQHDSSFLFPMALAAMLWLCGACFNSADALEDRSVWERQPDLQDASGPVRGMTIGTKETVQTVTVSPQGHVMEQITRNRADPSAVTDERVVYRYGPAGHLTGEFVEDSEGEWVPLRLYAYDPHGRLAGEAAYHLCRTFSALHLYDYDEADRLMEHRRFESRRLTDRRLQYGPNGRLATVHVYQNGRPFETASHHYNELGQVILVEWTSPDGTVERRISFAYDERGNLLTRIERHPADDARDRVEIISHEYDPQGNWTRRTVIRAVNPLDEEGQPLEDPVEVTERTIDYE